MAYSTIMNGGRPYSVTPRGTNIPQNCGGSSAVVTPVVTAAMGNAIQTPTPKHAVPNVGIEAPASGSSHKDSQPSQSAFKTLKKTALIA